MAKQTKYALVSTFLWFGIIEIIAYNYFTLLHSLPHGIFLAIWGVFIILYGLFFVVKREFPYIIYNDKIKFPGYWFFRNGCRTITKENIISLRKTHSRISRLEGIEITTKDGKRYLIVKFYEDDVLPYLQQMLDNRWEEVWKK